VVGEDAPVNRRPRKRSPLKLRSWVGIGTLVTTGVGLAVLLVFARLQAGKAVWENGFYLNGSQWFDAARTTVTLIGIIGLGGAAFLAYRKQLSTEATHILQETGELRGRYTTCAEQLGHDSPAIRQAGVYALASLADDWHIYGNDAERQVCIDLLCAYLRTVRAPSSVPTTTEPSLIPRRTVAGRKSLRLKQNPPRPPKPDPQEREVRAAVISVIKNRTGTSSPEKRWPNGVLTLSSADLTDANLTDASLIRADLSAADLTDAFLTAANLTAAFLIGADLTDADLTDANLTDANLMRADLNSADLTAADLTAANLMRADLTDADLTRADLNGASLINASLINATLHRADLTEATLIGTRLTGADLTEATLTEATLTGASLIRADLAGADLTRANLTGANLTGANLKLANLTEADLTAIRYSDETRWPDGFPAP
jgi:uncharacterized protein YjbI with pentapeptide repeats